MKPKITRFIEKPDVHRFVLHNHITIEVPFTESENVIFDGENVIFDGEQVISS